MNIEFLENLLNQISVSGSEENGQRVLREYMEQYADEIRTDEIGDVICVLNPESPVRIMLYLLKRFFLLFPESLPVHYLKQFLSLQAR